MEHSTQEQIRKALYERISQEKNLEDEQVREVVDELVLQETRGQYVSVGEKLFLGKDLFAQVRGLGLLQEFLEDGQVTEIMVNGTQSIFTERGGHIVQEKIHFDSREKLEDLVQQMAGKVNRTVNEAQPICDIRLLDGSRVNVVMPPVALEGPILTIRKFPTEGTDMQKLLGYGSLTPEAADFLAMLVRAKYNIFISGGTGSGKTTFLNALSHFIPSDERVITVEDSAELQIRGIPNLVRLEMRGANGEGKNEVSIRDLIRTALRMRPDRIILGEVRDAAAIDLLTALNTGHDGSLSTGHGNSPGDMLSRLETLVLLGMDIPLLAVRKQIASALEILVHLGRLRDKSRKVLEITEVLKCQEGEIQLNPLYVFQEEGEEDGRVLGKLVRTKHPFLQQDKRKKAGLKWNEV